MQSENAIELLGKEEGYVYSRETFGTVDGPGIRYVLFLQGCPLRCIYCHNPDSIPKNGGEKTTAGEAVDDILRYRNFTRKGGVTFSGGEPLMQPDFLLAMIKLLKLHNIHVAIDTSGIFGVNSPKVREIIDLSDLIILDIKAVDEDVSKRLCGATSDKAFGVLDYCEVTHKAVWVRQVILRDYTMKKESLELLADKLKTYGCVEQVELLPFHKLGEPKWELVDMDYLLDGVDATTPEEMKWVKEIFSGRGINVI